MEALIKFSLYLPELYLIRIEEHCHKGGMNTSNLEIISELSSKGLDDAFQGHCQNFRQS